MYDCNDHNIIRSYVCWENYRKNIVVRSFVSLSQSSQSKAVVVNDCNDVVTWNLFERDTNVMDD